MAAKSDQARLEVKRHMEELKALDWAQKQKDLEQKRLEEYEQEKARLEAQRQQSLK